MPKHRQKVLHSMLHGLWVNILSLFLLVYVSEVLPQDACRVVSLGPLGLS